MSKKSDDPLDKILKQYSTDAQLGTAESGLITAKSAINHLVEQRCLEARIDSLGNIWSNRIVPALTNEDEELYGRIRDAIAMERGILRGQLTNLQNKEK